MAIVIDALNIFLYAGAGWLLYRQRAWVRWLIAGLYVMPVVIMYFQVSTIWLLTASWTCGDCAQSRAIVQDYKHALLLSILFGVPSLAIIVGVFWYFRNFKLLLLALVTAGLRRRRPAPPGQGR